jgi:hypothetical protein
MPPCCLITECSLQRYLHGDAIHYKVSRPLHTDATGHLSPWLRCPMLFPHLLLSCLYLRYPLPLLLCHTYYSLLSSLLGFLDPCHALWLLVCVSFVCCFIPLYDHMFGRDAVHFGPKRARRPPTFIANPQSPWTRPLASNLVLRIRISFL